MSEVIARHTVTKRGPKPAKTAGEVISAAIAIADQAGIAGLTMQAVAARLGFTTMALYRYFPNKQALTEAIADAALGLPPTKEKPKEAWWKEVRHWAFGKRERLRARPWLAELPGAASARGANWLAWREAFEQAVSATPLKPADVESTFSLVDSYVRGSCELAADEQFDFGLERVLDGIQLYMDSL
jgi:AcrR family transcriptional regulator